MTTFAWPSGAIYLPRSMSWGQSHNNRASVSSLSQYTQTISVPGAKWAPTLNFPDQPWSERRLLEAFLTQLSGMEHRVQLWDMGNPLAAGLPGGTINLSGVTATGAQFATSITLAGCGAGKTLLANDKLSIAGQLLMNINDGTADGSGNLTITARHPLRATASSAAVTLNKPVALFIMMDPKLEFPREPGGTLGPVCPAFSVPFIEVFA